MDNQYGPVAAWLAGGRTTGVGPAVGTACLQMTPPRSRPSVRPPARLCLSVCCAALLLAISDDDDDAATAAARPR